jgi:hypothetical protein
MEFLAYFIFDETVFFNKLRTLDKDLLAGNRDLRLNLKSHIGTRTNGLLKRRARMGASHTPKRPTRRADGNAGRLTKAISGSANSWNTLRPYRKAK